MVEAANSRIKNEKLNKQILESQASIKPKYKRVELPANGFLKLKEEQAVGQFEEKFICMICTEVVERPSMCKNCSRSFCSDCIAGWATKNADCPCPNCQKPF